MHLAYLLGILLTLLYLISMHNACHVVVRIAAAGSPPSLWGTIDGHDSMAQHPADVDAIGLAENNTTFPDHMSPPTGRICDRNYFYYA